MDDYRLGDARPDVIGPCYLCGAHQWREYTRNGAFHGLVCESCGATRSEPREPHTVRRDIARIFRDDTRRGGRG